MEVVKYSGKTYPPRTVYGIVCGLKRHVRDKNGDEALNPLDAHDKRYGKLSTLFFACLVNGINFVQMRQENHHIF